MSQFRFSSVWRGESRNLETIRLTYQEVHEFFGPFKSFYEHINNYQLKRESIVTSAYYDNIAVEVLRYEVSKIKITLFGNRLVTLLIKTKITLITSCIVCFVEYSLEDQIDHQTTKTLFGAQEQILKKSKVLK